MPARKTGLEIRLQRPGLREVIPFFCLRSGNSENHIHQKCHRVPEPGDPQIYQNTRLFPDR